MKLELIIRILKQHKKQVLLVILTMIIFILFLISMFSFFVMRYIAYESRPPLPPGPNSLPYIGSLITMLRNKPTFRWIDRMMDEMNTNILCIRIGSVHLIPVRDPMIAREFLKDKDEISSSRPDCMSSYLTSDGYLNTYLAPMGDHWKKMRKILSSDILSLIRLKWLQNKRDEEADYLVRYIYNRCQTNVEVTKGVMNVRVIVQQYANTIIRKMVFGRRYLGKGSADGGPGDEDIEHADSLATIAAYVFGFCVTDYFPWLRWITDFDGHEKIIRDSLLTARKYQDPLIDERIKQWKDGVRTKEYDLLDVFINLENPQLNAATIKAQILDLILGSFDNMSNNVEWAMAEMINEPMIYAKAVHELDSMVGKDRLVQESDLVNLNYIKSCVKEALRLHPVSAFGLPHMSTKDTTVSGYFIPKGSHILVSRMGLGRNPEVWDDPLTYNPDRHMNDGKEVVLTDHNLNMISFSTGRRGCPAVIFGTTMTVMLLARLIQGFTWEMPPSETQVDLKENLQSLWKAKPLFALVRPRLPHHLYELK